MAKRPLEIGAVRSVNPARREVRVTPLPGMEGHFTGLRRVSVLLTGPGTPNEMNCRVEKVQERADDVILTLTPGVSRDDVARMKGAIVATEAAEVEEEMETGYGWLEGFQVVDQTGRRLGKVARVYPTGANDVIEVAKCGGGTFLLPAIPQVIACVERESPADGGPGVLVVNEIAPYIVEDAADAD